jgi:hypothetical protein
MLFQYLDHPTQCSRINHAVDPQMTATDQLDLDQPRPPTPGLPWRSL